MIIAESRPLCEGVALAGALTDSGVQCTVVTDAQTALFVQQADVVLVGADQVTEHAVVNKTGTLDSVLTRRESCAVLISTGSHNRVESTGTLLAALAARHAGVPMYAVADSSKFSAGPVATLVQPVSDDTAVQHEENDAGEVTSTWPESLRLSAGQLSVRNVYFEEVPLDLLTGLVTEAGFVSTADICSAIERLAHDVEVAFLQDGNDSRVH